MSLQFLLWIVAGILMAISAFVSTPRVSLAALAWALFIFGWAAGSEVQLT